MQEYWVNVFDFSNAVDAINPDPIQLGYKYPTRNGCLLEEIDWGVWKQKLIYRIHVKMKPVKPKYELNDGQIRYM